MSVERFLGLWALDRGNSEYHGRFVPRRGLYRLAAGPEGVEVAVWWVDAEGTDRSAGYRLVADGLERDLGNGSMLRSWLDDGSLFSEVSVEGEVVHHARRTLVSVDAMEVFQRDARGPTTALYRRVRTDVKQVLLYRRDLKMRKGKIAAQIAHASLAVFLRADEGVWDRLEVPLDPAMASWARARCAKIVLSVESEADLIRAYELAREAGLPAALITDAGHTEFHGVPTRTTVAIGPAPIDRIDPITGRDGAVRTKLA